MAMKKALSFATLCAMARAEFSPTLDTADWIEAVKCRLVRQRYEYPSSPDMLATALTSVENALARKGIHREHPVEQPELPTERSSLSHAEACDALAQLRQRGFLPAWKAL